jgi:hypothetical protein
MKLRMRQTDRETIEKDTKQHIDTDTIVHTTWDAVVSLDELVKNGPERVCNRVVLHGSLATQHIDDLYEPRELVCGGLLALESA